MVEEEVEEEEEDVVSYCKFYKLFKNDTING